MNRDKTRLGVGRLEGSSKIRLLFLIENLGAGGAERVLVNLVNRLDATKYEITLRTLFDEGDNRKRLSESVRYESVFVRSFRGVNFLDRVPGRIVYNLIARGDFDVILVYLHGALTRIVASAPPGQVTVAYLHANMRNSPFMRSFRNRQQLQNCFDTYNAVVCVSEDVAESYRNASGMSDRVHVIHNVFDTDAIRTAATQSLGLDIIAEPPAINICSVGKLTKVKGYDRLVRVAGLLRDEGLIFNLLIVGDGPERQMLQELIDQRQLSSFVKLVGYDNNPYKYVSRCDLFVSSSYSEGFSSVVVESIVLGIPVLATDCSGMKEILGENDEYGIVVDNTEEGLSSGIRRLLQDPRIILSYREKAVERAEHFGSEKAVADFEKLLASVMRGS